MIHDSNNFILTIAPNVAHCDDAYVGYISFNGKFIGPQNNDELFLYRNIKNNQQNQQRQRINYVKFNNSENKKIVIILESPSNNEYNNICEIVSPAMGNTGGRINKQLIPLLNRSISKLNINPQNLNINVRYDIYLVNAIRYHCDLGDPQSRKKVKFIFTFLWDKFNYDKNEDLIERLNIIKPDIIINSCTQDLRNLCSKNYLQNSQCTMVLDASSHPLCWNINTILQ